ncbi:hypothetical protein NVP3058O_130 [Vibrio phage 3.058.O._10N.286.46.B8]|nr:hypothetical protein NVP2058O_131 [Vibrio phage 2.058.O._10N.286.46.B8]AUS03200.1 hypothetical protein NVP3058O_130 [Vibrio phage 3.058.O._10N.286.46.B8]
MTKEYEITDGETTMVVGQKAIDGGILERGFRLTSEEPTNTNHIEDKTDDSNTVVESKVPKKELAKNVNEIVKEPVVEQPKPDFKHALTLSESELDKYAAEFDCKLDGRKSLNDMRETFAQHFDFEWTKPEEVKKTDLPEDLLCPHCGTKARTEKSYKNNHGDKCYKALKVK